MIVGKVKKKRKQSLHEYLCLLMILKYEIEQRKESIKEEM